MRRLSFQHPGGGCIDFAGPPFRTTALWGLDHAPTRVLAAYSPGQDGYSLLGLGQGAREVCVQGLLTPSPSQDADALRRFLVTSLDPRPGLGMLTCVSGGKVYRTGALAVDSPLLPEPTPLRPHQRFFVRFQCPDPFWQEADEGVHTIEYFDSCLAFPGDGIGFPDGGMEIARYDWPGGRWIDVVNPGDLEAPVTIRFTGPVENPVVRHSGTGEFVRIVKRIEACQAVHITTGFGKKDVRIESGDVLTGAMQYLDLGSTFLSLKPGMNRIEFSNESPGEGSVATIRFRARYQGV